MADACCVAAVRRSRYTKWSIDGERGALVAELLTEEEKQEQIGALITAADAGDAEAVRRCLRDGADPNAADGNGCTALFNAAWKNQVGCLEALCDAGANLDTADVAADGVSGSDGEVAALLRVVEAGECLLKRRLQQRVVGRRDRGGWRRRRAGVHEPHLANAGGA